MTRPPELPDSEVLTVTYLREPLRAVTCMGFCGRKATAVYVSENSGDLVAACCIDHATDWLGVYRR